MIRINQLKLRINHTEADLKMKVLKSLHLKEDALLSYRIKKQSIDARKKPELSFVYTVDVSVKNENKIIKKIKDKNIMLVSPEEYNLPESGTEIMQNRPVVVGSGPAGLFCAYMLALKGYAPILIERGTPVEQRVRDVEAFWNSGELKKNSNVQFGEGGAGTFSDGKLNTLVKDTYGRNTKVLEIFTKHGASEDIMYVNKPHIGTDVLVDIVRNMREHIIKNGGEVLFNTKLIKINVDNQSVSGITVEDTFTGEHKNIMSNNVVLAIGHSARDTFQMLYESEIPMHAKAFAVGVRVEHPQTMINYSQYGVDESEYLQAAAYKLTENLENGRGVYTFCMCPGGYVVNASSEKNRLAVNGMSYHDRAGKNANSAVIVTVSPEDYGYENALSGIEFQRRLEENAYQAGNGKVPVQLFGDFCENKVSTKLGEIEPQIKGEYTFGNVREIFPLDIAQSIEMGIKAFDKKIKGYARKDAIISGVESRTSSPVRILRDENFQSTVKGLYPCGEGAGYAGGITSAAMDGIKVAEAIIKQFAPFDICAND